MERFRILMLSFLVLFISSSFVLAENIAVKEMGGTFSCSPAYGGATAERAFDGNFSTNMALLVKQPELYIIREWEQTAILDSIQLRLYAPTLAPDFEICVWEYGMWKTIKIIRDNEATVVDIPLGGIQTRKMMYRPLRFNSASYHHIYEIVVEGTLQEPFVPKPEEFFAERQGAQIYLGWDAPLETKEGAQAISYNILKAEVVDGSYGNWEIVESGLLGNSWTGSGDVASSVAYCVIAVDKWGHTSEMATPIVLEAQGKITGRVIDEPSLAPLAGAQVKALGLQIAAITNSNGEFSLEHVSVGNVELEVSKKGYIREMVTVKLAAAGILDLNIAIEQEAEIPGSPAFLTANSQSGKVTLEWTSPGNGRLGALRYNLYRSETPNIKAMNPAPLAAELTATRWVDTTAIPGKIYYYAITAVSVTSHESAFSNEVKATSLPQSMPVLVAPSLNTVIHNNYVVMRWEPVLGASHYYIEYSLSPKFTSEQTRRRTIRTGTELVDLGLSDGNWYWRVQAIFEDNTVSEFSQIGTFSVVNTLSGNSPEVAFFDLWPKVVGKEPYVNIHYILNVGDHLVTIRVFDLNGRCVKTFFENYNSMAGHHEFSWDGRGDNKQLLKKGLYIMQFVATKPGQKYEVRKKIIVMN